MTDDRFKTGGAFDALPDQATRIELALRGRLLSGYKVERLIGAGGMGYVLLATRAEGDFERTAAIKVVPATLGTSELVQRFRTEVQILGKLNHPAIAQLYDAGETDEGWPYLVMEYVDGFSVDRYCEDNALPMADRVRVLAEVCRAVRFAHTRLVIHRDLKPSNVMVTREGQPKLLDFGIAKLLQPGTDGQTAAHRPMTPKYASPEQLLGADITTGSDIYQLGVLFLAVLGDEAPSEDSSLKEAIRRAAAGYDTEISARTRRKLPEDLVAVVSKCLHSDPDDRYADLNALIADLDAYRDGYPVAARQGSTLYKLRKLVTRNVAATVVAVGAMAVVLSSSAYYAVSLTNARNVAQARADTSTELLQAMTSMITDTYSELIESRGERASAEDTSRLENEPLRVVLDRTQALIDGVTTDDPAVRAELLLMQGVTNGELSQFDVARQQLREALSLAESNGMVSVQVSARTALADIGVDDASLERAREHIDAAVTLIAQRDVPARVAARALTSATHIYAELGKSEQALTYVRQSIDILEALPQGPSLGLASAYSEAAGIYGRMEQRDELRLWAQRAIDLFIELEGPNYRGLGPAFSSLAYSYAIDGEYKTADDYFSRELSIALANFGEQHIRTAGSLVNLGITQRRLGNYETAIEQLLRARAILENISSSGSQQYRALSINLGNTYRDVGRLDDAVATYNRGLASYDASPANSRFRAFLLNNSGELMVMQGHAREGRARLREALAIKSEVLGNDHISTARSMLLLVQAQLISGDVTDAEALLSAADAIYVANYGRGHRKMAFLELTFGLYARTQNDLENARERLELAYALRLEANDERHIDVIAVALEIAKVELAAGQLERMRFWLDKAAPGVAELRPEQIERIEADIAAAEWLAASGDDASAQRRKESVLQVLDSYFPQRQDWRRRLEAI